jgi:tyrosyl-tRNA synthetase
MPLLEGLDGVQKMSKSLGNAIGINEPPDEMYGKLMSINDELMWKYWVFLTDLRQSEVDLLKADVEAGRAHPMEVKKRLARTIVAGFHSEAAAQAAGENWARMFQQKGFSENVEEVRLKLADYLAQGDGAASVKLAAILTACGLTASNAEAQRKLKEGAVKVNDAVVSKPSLEVGSASEVKLQIRLGKKAKLVVLGQ